MHTAAYAAWEVALAAFCFAVLSRVEHIPRRLALFLALDLTVAGLAAMALSFAGQNSVPAYLGLAAVFALAAFVITRGRTSTRGRITIPNAVLAAAFLLGAMIAFSVRPVEEVDSLYNLHYAIRWVRNLATPYEFAYNYVPFWDLTYTPLVTLAQRDTFFWAHSLKPIVLLGVLLYLIAREIEIPGDFAVYAIAALMLLPHLWIGPSGLATNKNDMMHAAGYAMAALAGLRAQARRFDGLDWLWVAFAAVFVCVKSSGPLAILAAACIAGVLFRSGIVRHGRLAAAAGTGVFALWMACAGHFFLRNYLRFGNPVYPYEIRFWPVHFPGLADQSGTSFLAGIGDPAAWRLLLLPQDGTFPAGILFPVAVPLIAAGSAAVVAHAAWRRRLSPLTVLALFQLAAWWIFVRSFYSASAIPGDLHFLRNALNSIRYVEGPLLIGELALVAILLRRSIPAALVALLLAVHAASCVQVLLRRSADPPWAAVIFGGAALAAIAWMLGRVRYRLPAAAAAVVLLLLGGERLVERLRPDWLPGLKPLYAPLRDLPAQDLYYVIDDPYSQQNCWHVPMLGRHMQHGAASGSREQLRRPGRNPTYVVWVPARPGDAPPDPEGYTLIAKPASGRLYRR
jgi:hypothetical protein